MLHEMYNQDLATCYFLSQKLIHLKEKVCLGVKLRVVKKGGPGEGFY